MTVADLIAHLQQLPTSAQELPVVIVLDDYEGDVAYVGFDRSCTAPKIVLRDCPLYISGGGR